MYFKVSMRHNPATGLPGGYYRLVESYRNELDNICHRTLLNIGFTDLTPEQLNAIRTLLNDRLERRMNLFENEDPRVKELANQYWNELVSKGKIDVSDKAYRQQRRMVDADTIKNKDAREIGAEWMCLQAVEQLKIGKTLEALGWEEEKIQLAVTQIISRAVYPFSEYRTSRRINGPQPKVMEIYKVLNYKYCPFSKRKSVVHKPELKNFEGRYPSGFDDG
jgi:hypothetical protein